jgi:hypothetical protein
MVAAAAPVAEGGALADGTYRLTKIVLYTGPGGATGPLSIGIQQTIAIHGATADAVSIQDGKTQRDSQSLAISGATVTFTPTCPSAEPPHVGSYTASAGTLRLYLPNDVGQLAEFTYEP